MTLVWSTWGLRNRVLAIAISTVEQLARMTSVVLIVFSTSINLVSHEQLGSDFLPRQPPQPCWKVNIE